jgi:hypothetical protein
MVKFAEKPEPAVVVHDIVMNVILIIFEALPVIVKTSVVAAAGTIPLAQAAYVAFVPSPGTIVTVPDIGIAL